jgi:hypothetical protein
VGFCPDRTRIVTAHQTLGRGAELEEDVKMRPPPEEGGGCLDLCARGAGLDCPLAPRGEGADLAMGNTELYCSRCLLSYGTQP